VIPIITDGHPIAAIRNQLCVQTTEHIQIVTLRAVSVVRRVVIGRTHVAGDTLGYIGIYSDIPARPVYIFIQCKTSN